MRDNRPQHPEKQLRRTLLQVHEEALEETSRDKSLQGKVGARLAPTPLGCSSPHLSYDGLALGLKGVETGRSWEIVQREKSLSHQ